MRRVIEEAAALREQGQVKAAKTWLRRYSIDEEITALAGFNHVDAFTDLWSDDLCHGCFLGTGRKIDNGVFLNVQAKHGRHAGATFREVDLRWDIARVEFRVPNLAKSRLRTVYKAGKKAQKRLRACEHAARLAALPSMLTGTFTCGRVERDLSDEAASITGYLGWVRLLEAGEHTETSVAELHELCLELQEQLIRVFPTIRWDKSLKFANMRAFAEHILEVGLLAMVDSGLGESLLAVLKPEAQNTNYRPETMGVQVVRRALQRQRLREMGAAFQRQPTGGNAGRGMLQRARAGMVGKEQNRVAPESRPRALMFIRLLRTGAMVCVAQPAQPEVEPLARSLGLFLAGRPQHDSRQPDALLDVNLPMPPRRFVERFSKCGLTVWGSDPPRAEMLQADSDFCASVWILAGEDDDPSQELWYARLICMFDHHSQPMPFGPLVKQPPMAFVRYYEQYDTQPVTGRPQLRWEARAARGGGLAPAYDVVPLSCVGGRAHIIPDWGYGREQREFFVLLYDVL